MHWCSVLFLVAFAWPAHTLAEEQQPRLLFDSVTMQRTACYGTCPVYTVTVSADGAVVFIGEKFVRAKGKHVGSANIRDLIQLDRELDAIEFFSLQPSYWSEKHGCTSWATDNPTVSITVAAKHDEHKVTYYYGCTIDIGETIAKLSDTIDDVAGVRTWVGK